MSAFALLASLLPAGASPADVLDILAGATLCVGAVVGLLRGLSGELARLAGLVAAGVACWAMAGPWHGLCAGWFGGSDVASGAATLGGVLAASVLAAWIARRIVDTCLRILVPQPANAILGAAAGVASLFLVVAALCYLLQLLPFEAVRDSLLGPSRTWAIVAGLFGW